MEDHALQPEGIHRLDEKVQRLELIPVEGEVHVTGEEHQHNLGINGLDVAGQIEAAHVPHLDVQEDQVDRGAAEKGDRLRAAGDRTGYGHIEKILQQRGQMAPSMGFVVD